ncbi:MAG TPA: hypothetical protein DHV12_01365, partial [Thermotogae bacterium]|nr:hypothetical protein [Thermotogota bacterium]
VDMFVDKLFQILIEALVKKGEKVVWLFDRGFADSRFMERIKERIVFVIRVRRDCWVEVEGKEGYAGKLEGFKKKGFFERVSYHKEKKLELKMYSNLYGDDPMFLVSNSAKGLHLIYKLRAQIEQGFRDIKSLYGFKHLELRKKNQERIEMLLCLVSITMGLLMVGYEKSGYRWRKEVYRRKQVYSLVRVIKRVIEDSWKGLELEPYFPLSLSVLERG